MRLMKFALVGGCGAVINSAALYLLTNAGIHYLAASAVATETAIVSNFIGNYFFTFSDRSGRIFEKFGRFQIVSLLALIVTMGVLWLLTSSFGIEFLLVWNLIAIVIAFIVNFMINMKWTWNIREVRI